MNRLAASNFRNTAVVATAVAVRGDDGRIIAIHAYNPNGSASYLKIYNIAAASVAVGTDATTAVLGIAANSGASFYPERAYFNTAIAVAATTEAADTGTTAPGTGLVVWIVHEGD